MIKTSRKPITNSRITGHLFKRALIMLAGAATMMGLAAVPAGATPSAAARTAPPNQAPRSAVAVAFDSTGSGFAFYRGTDHAVYMRTFFGAGRWSAQSRIGGQIVGAPAAAVARTTVVVAARGTDNTLRLRMMHNGTWGRWTSWGGTLSASPAITGTSLGRIDVFIRGADHALWTRTLRPGQPLTPWTRLGGHLSTAPAAVAVSENSFEVAAGGPGHFVWVASSPGWAWTSLGGRRTDSAPAIGYIPESNGGWVLIRGTDNALWGKGSGGGGSTPWQRISSKLITGAPSAAGTRQPTPHIIAVIRDTGLAPWATRYPTATGGWSAFTRPWIPQG
jgi:hypothetical protein